MSISFVVAMCENRVIGVNNRLPWNIPADLQRFKKITSGHPIIMGRNTFDSIGRILPNRTNIIVTRNPYYTKERALIAHSLEEAISLGQKSQGGEEVFIIGGGELFVQGLPLVDKIYLTLIHTQIAGDTYFPVYPEQEFQRLHEEKVDGDPAFTFLDLQRKSSSRQ